MPQNLTRLHGMNVNRDYAEEFADRWVIVSAKYGFIDPEFVVSSDYNVTCPCA